MTTDTTLDTTPGSTWRTRRRSTALRFRRPSRRRRGLRGDRRARSRAANPRTTDPVAAHGDRSLREELEGSTGLRPPTRRRHRRDRRAGGRPTRRSSGSSATAWPRSRSGATSIPEHRRRGLGRALLRENLRRADRAGGRGAGDGQASEPRGLRRGDRGQAIAPCSTQQGFEPIRWFFLMRRSDRSTTIPDAPLPEGLELRPVTADQHRAIFDAEAEAFRDHWAVARADRRGLRSLTYAQR